MHIIVFSEIYCHWVENYRLWIRWGNLHSHFCAYCVLHRFYITFCANRRIAPIALAMLWGLPWSFSLTSLLLSFPVYIKYHTAWPGLWIPSIFVTMVIMFAWLLFSDILLRQLLSSFSHYISKLIIVLMLLVLQSICHRDVFEALTPQSHHRYYPSTLYFSRSSMLPRPYRCRYSMPALYFINHT